MDALSVRSITRRSIPKPRPPVGGIPYSRVMIPDQDQPDPQTTALLYAKTDTLTDVISLLK